MSAPKSASWAGKARATGPDPANTIRRPGRKRWVLASVCRPPAVSTPGRVQPGNTTGRSCAPGAMITRAALTAPGPVVVARIAVQPSASGSRSTTEVRRALVAGHAVGAIDQRPAEAPLRPERLRVGHGEARTRLFEDLAAERRALVDEQGSQPGGGGGQRGGHAGRPTPDHQDCVPLLVDHGSAARGHRREVRDAEVLLVQRGQRAVVLRLAQERVQRRHQAGVALLHGP